MMTFGKLFAGMDVQIRPNIYQKNGIAYILVSYKDFSTIQKRSKKLPEKKRRKKK